MARNLSPRHTLRFHRSCHLSKGGTMFVSDILTQKGGLVFTVSAGTTVAQIAQQLSTRRIGAVLVMGVNDEVAGIVSERDLVRAMSLHGAAALELEARHVMTREVVTCDPDDSLDLIMEAMTRGRFRHLPVVRHGELLGVVSIGDVVKAQRDHYQGEVDTLQTQLLAGEGGPAH